MRGIELAVMVLLGLLVLLFVVRPLVRRIITPEDAARCRLRRRVAGPQRRRRHDAATPRQHRPAARMSRSSAATSNRADLRPTPRR